MSYTADFNTAYTSTLSANNIFSNATAMNFAPYTADGSTAIAYLLGTVNTLSNATARIVSLKNGATEKSYTLANGTTNYNGNYHASFTTYTLADKAYVDSTVSGHVTSPSGTNTQVQFNNAGSFGASSGLTYNSTLKDLSVNYPYNPLARLSVGADSSKFISAMKNMFNFVDPTYNKSRSTWANATDTSSFNFSFTPNTGKPILNITNNIGGVNFSLDTTGSVTIGGKLTVSSNISAGTSINAPSSVNTGSYLDMLMDHWVFILRILIYIINHQTEINLKVRY